MSANLKILELAQLKTDEVVIGGKKFYLNEPGALDMVEYKAKAADEVDKKGKVTKEGDKVSGLALLIERCCFNDEERKQKSFTREEALAIARGSSRVALPLLNKLLQWIGGVEEEPDPNAGAPSESSSSN